MSAEVLRVEEGSLYPAFRRLEVGGLVAAEWGVSENNRRVRFYRLTPRGRRRLESELERWDALVAAIARVLETAQVGSRLLALLRRIALLPPSTRRSARRASTRSPRCAGNDQPTNL